MEKDVSENYVHIQPAKPSAGLFDKIIGAIKEEGELKQSKKILYLCAALLLISVASLPFSTTFFINQWQASGAYYFMSSTATNMGLFFAAWQDFVLSILESLPVFAMALFAANVALLLFTARLFLYKKGMLITLIKHRFA